MRNLTFPTIACILACMLAGCGDASSETRLVPIAADSPLLKPSATEMNDQAPALYHVVFETSAGRFVLEIVREQSPHGADRLYNLARHGYYDGNRFFRVVEDFVVQFGLHGDPSLTAIWRDAGIPDDPVNASNVRGTVTFAARSMPNSRTTQLFINLKDNAMLDRMGFAPLGRVAEGLDVVDRLYSGYGEGAPRGGGPDQMRIMSEGNAYLDQQFPRLDYVISTQVIVPGDQPEQVDDEAAIEDEDASTSVLDAPVP